MKIVVLLVAIAVLGWAGGFAYRWIDARLNPESAFEDFLAHTNRSEDQLMDPLVLAGDPVVPYVLEAIRDPDMELRRYAILFLGNCGSVDALPALFEIVENETEKDYFRGDALASIHRIDPAAGLDLARKYSGRSDFLGRRASEISDGEDESWVQRSHIEALLGWHG